MTKNGSLRKDSIACSQSIKYCRGPKRTSCVFTSDCCRAAGLAHFLPGLDLCCRAFFLMFALSWLYVSFGITSPIFQSIFLGMQPAVGALIVSAVQRIGSHALHDNRWLWGIALLAGFAQIIGINFGLTLLTAGLIYALHQSGHSRPALGLGAASALLIGFYAWSFSGNPIAASASTASGVALGDPSLLTLLGSGLRSGLLTFGGAYTVIPFLQQDAVEVGRWMTNAQFLDGLALSGLLPAPLIIFSTFVGYIGGGPLGALVMTFGIFLPAFAFTMIGHDYLERLVENQSAHAFLDGVTAGVVGLIAATALTILSESVVGISAWVIFSLALLALFRLKAKWTVAAVVLSAGILGFFLNL